MFEQNGQWFAWGNRTLCSLNLSVNGISDYGVRALIDAVMDQESAIETLNDGILGLYRIILQVRKICCRQGLFRFLYDSESLRTGKSLGPACYPVHAFAKAYGSP
jgi:hypothetical protein